MNFFRAAISLVALILVSFTANSDASIQKGSESLINVRTWNHAKYLRIVLEGSESVIAKGKVSQEKDEIIVDFADSEFIVVKKKSPITYRTDKNAIKISLKKPATLKTFTLSNPSRIVIDVYEENNKESSVKNKVKTKNEEKIKKDIQKVTSKTDKKDNKVKANQDEKKVSHKAVGTEEKMPVKPDVKKQEDETVANNVSSDPEDVSFIPSQYKGLWSLLQSGNFYTVLKELPNFEPKDLKSLAAYHYMYGDAYRTAQQYLDAIKHLRLAYLYAQDKSLKERALFERAELYEKLELVYESRANYLVFIKQFPSSTRLKDAHLGLAETLAKMTLYNEAVEHYTKAGNAPEILFSKANSLQRTGKVSQARRAYADALLADTKYPSKSPETYFYIGENMRMLGELEEAKRHLRSLDFGPYRDRSRLSLGHIAMEESDTYEAITNYKAASKSSDREVRVEGLFHLSKALLKAERLEEAISNLETIRHNYMNSGLYKDTLLDLSKLYKKDGKMKEAVSLLKELVYGMQAPREAFKEIEDILLKTSEGSDFVALWREIGQWMIDETREDLLIQVSAKLRAEGQSFVKLSTWLVENGSKQVRGGAAVDLADYYIGIGNVEDSQKYMDIARKAKVSGDASLRVEAKLFQSAHEYSLALEKIMLIEKFKSEDLDLVGSIITRLNKSDDRLKAVAFYETVLNSNEWAAENYNRMADILYTRNEKNKALKYYKIALQKSPEDEWATYRIGSDGGSSESEKMFGQLQQSNTLLGRLAKTKLKEIDLINKMKEVY